MTTPPTQPTEWTKASYLAFNADRSVGVRCTRDGVITGLRLKPTALERGERWLATEIPHVASIAHAKSMHGLRREMEEHATIEGRPVPHDLMHEMKLPTAHDIQELELAEQERTITTT